MKFADMPSTTGTGRKLASGAIILPAQPNMMCSEWGEEHGVYSAERGDYWNAADDAEVKCECGGDMMLVRHVDYWEAI